jgi:general secretion pathway protein F
MPTYRFKAYSSDGRLDYGDLEANSKHEAVRLLAARGLIPVKTEEKKAASTRFLAGRSDKGTRCSFRDYTVFARQLSDLLLADLTIDQALRLLAADTSCRSISQLSKKLLADVVSGTPLSDSLNKHAKRSPPMIVSLVRAGEAKGNIGSSLNDLANTLDGQLAFREKVRSALIYPAILAATALGAVGVIAVVLVPNLMPLFRDSGRPPPFILKLIEGAGLSVSSNWPAMLAGVLLLILAARVIGSKPATLLVLVRFVGHLPLIGDLSRDHSTGLAARTLGGLLQSGVPIVGALGIVADSLSNPVYSAAFRQFATQLKEGDRLSSALRQSGLFSSIAIVFVTVGEETGRLDRMLLKLGKVIEDATQRRVERAMIVIGPTLTLAIGLLVGMLMITVMQALLSLNEIVLT